MKSIVFLVLLFTSQFSSAKISKAEFTCVSKNIYYEARGDKKSWVKAAQVVYTRGLLWKKGEKFSSKSSNLCDIVKSPEFSTRKLLNKPIKEKKTFKEIEKTLKTRNWMTLTKHSFYKTGKNGLFFYASR